MPQFIKFPVESEAEFERFAAERLALNAGQRLSAEWQPMVASGRVQATVGRGDLHEDEQLAAAHKPARENGHASVGPTVGADSSARCAT